ncbi:MAG: GIY-YIG nuclease family protein [Bacteroidota bacterium]|nr:GIY-YIG nuclease family protein [Bacteroidota bacterium]
MSWIYILWSKKLKKRYVGSTEDVESRLKQHNAGKTRFTMRGVPWLLIHSEEFVTKSKAMKRERFLKNGIGRKWLDERFPNYRRGV